MKRAYLGNWGSLQQITKSALDPSLRGEMVQKVLTRLREGKTDDASQASGEWCRSIATEVGAFCSAIDPELWRESVETAARIEADANRKLATLDFDLGGGGNYPLLYFFVRHLRPKVVVETGVAAGFSTAAILSAIKANGQGHLYSSEFPYFRISDPVKYVGYVVDDELKANWTLSIEGDRKNLPGILAAVDQIDLFHYDSDKSYSGRKLAVDLVTPKLAPGAPVIMDDLQDNLFFRDHVKRLRADASVFEFLGKYVGLYYA